MKKSLTITIILLAFVFMESNSQTFCHTPASSTNKELYSSLINSAQVQESYCLRIYIHTIRRSNGTGGQTAQEVNQALNYLDIDFNPHGIYFYWDGNIDYIDNDSYYNTPTTTIYTINNHSDGIDIYLFDDSSEPGGRANGIGESSEFWVSGSYWKDPFGSLVKSHVISHEMGHVLFLWHTHHGTYYEGGDSEQCAELVDGSNSNSCGDYVQDTPADPHLQFNVNSPACTWNGSGIDANGDSYNPDEALVMAYTHPDCMSYFSIGQGQRMRNAIATLPHLISSVTDCGTNCPANLTIIQNVTSGNTDIQNASETITASNIIENGATAIYKAGQRVTLSSGFHARYESSFLASIEICESTQKNMSNVRVTGKTKSNSQDVLSIEPIQNTLSIYPNPSKSKFTMIVNGFDEYSVKIVNVMGNIIKVKSNLLEKKQLFDLSNYPKGVYLILVYSNDNVISKRIIIE